MVGMTGRGLVRQLLLRASLIVALAASTLLGACGTGGGSRFGDASRDADSYARAIGRCGTDPDDIDHADAVGFLLGSTEWYQLLEPVPDAGAVDAEGILDQRTRTESVTVVPIGAGRAAVGAPRSVQLQIHGSFLPGAVDALSRSADVYLAMAGAGGGETGVPMVGLVAVRLQDGRYVFPGECEYALVYQPIRAAFGVDADSTLDRAVGLTGDALRDVLAPEPDPSPAPAETAVFLHPGGVPDAVLADLATVAVEVSWPEWMAQQGLLICSRIDTGWNDCVDTSVDQPVRTQMYVDPSARVLDWVVLGRGGDTSAVLADLGGVQIAGSSSVVIVSGASLESLDLVAG